MNTLKGYRTYLTAGAAIVYFIGAKYGYFVYDEKIIGIIGAAAVIFLRAAIPKTIQGEELRTLTEGAGRLLGGTLDTTREEVRPKIPALVGVFALLAVVFQTGCASFSNGIPLGTNSLPSTAGNVLHVAFFAAAQKHLKDNPNDRIFIERAVLQLADLESNTNGFDLGMVLAEFGQIGDDDAQLAINSAWLLYELELKKYTPAQQPAFIRESAASVRLGLERALRLTPPLKKISRERDGIKPRKENWERALHACRTRGASALPSI